LGIADGELIAPRANVVMPGLVPGIHVFILFIAIKTWMAGTSPAMTALGDKP
jgi:hypothetical protein